MPGTIVSFRWDVPNNYIEDKNIFSEEVGLLMAEKRLEQELV